MRWLQNMGAFVTNPMPLDPAQQLRFDVLNEDREHVLAELREQDWTPTIGVVHMRFHHDELVPCTTFEIALPSDPPVMQQNRVIPKDDGKRERQHSHETEAIVNEWYGMKKR